MANVCNIDENDNYAWIDFALYMQSNSDGSIDTSKRNPIRDYLFQCVLQKEPLLYLKAHNSLQESGDKIQAFLDSDLDDLGIFVPIDKLENDSSKPAIACKMAIKGFQQIGKHYGKMMQKSKSHPSKLFKEMRKKFFPCAEEVKDEIVIDIESLRQEDYLGNDSNKIISDETQKKKIFKSRKQRSRFQNDRAEEIKAENVDVTKEVCAALAKFRPSLTKKLSVADCFSTDGQAELQTPHEKTLLS